LLLFSPFYPSANVPFHLFPRKSVNHVRNQSKQPTFSFIVCHRGLGLGQVFPNFLRPCTSSAFRYMSMFPKISYDNKAEENKNIDIFTVPISIY